MTKEYEVIDGVIQGKEKMKFDWEYDLTNGRSRGHNKTMVFYLKNIVTGVVIALKERWKKINDKWDQCGYKWTQNNLMFFIEINDTKAIITKITLKAA